MKDYIEALKEIKKESKDFKITLSRKEVLEITNYIDSLHSIIKEVREHIENTTINCEGVAEELIDDILEILDKEKNNG